MSLFALSYLPLSPPPLTLPSTHPALFTPLLYPPLPLSPQGRIQELKGEGPKLNICSAKFLPFAINLAIV